MGYIATGTGRVFDYLDINKDNINLEDIATSLPRLNRFLGHSTRTYSVGEHSLYCLAMAEKLGYSTREKLLVLVHDFAEAYVGDCPAPLKSLIPEFSAIEDKVDIALYEYMEIAPPTKEEEKKIKVIDFTMLMIEMKEFTSHDYKQMMNSDVLTQFFNDPDFYLKEGKFSEEYIKKEIISQFNKLVTQYKYEVR